MRSRPIRWQLCPAGCFLRPAAVCDPGASYPMPCRLASGCIFTRTNSKRSATGVERRGMTAPKRLRVVIHRGVRQPRLRGGSKREIRKQSSNMLYTAAASRSPPSRDILARSIAPRSLLTDTASLPRLMTTARLWDGRGKPLAILQRHAGWVWRGVFSCPTAAASSPRLMIKTARLWDGAGKPLAALRGHAGTVWSAVFSPDGHRILTASDDTTARLWDGDGNLITPLRGHTGMVWSAVSLLTAASSPRLTTGQRGYGKWCGTRRT